MSAPHRTIRRVVKRRFLVGVCAASLVVIVGEVAALARPAPIERRVVTASEASLPSTTVAPLGDGPVLVPVPSAPTTTVPNVPVPVPAGDVDQPRTTPPVPVFHITIPKIDLDADVFEGVDLDTLSNGPGYWPGSAKPGHVGNLVIAGHRITWSHPFHDLDQLAPGDMIEVGGARYSVDRTFVVEPEDTWIINPTPSATLTLFACHPPGSAAHRIVVTGKLVAAASA